MIKKITVFLCLLIALFLGFTIRFIVLSNSEDEILLGDTNIVGDIDGDGHVKINDYILIRKHLIKRQLLTGDKLKKADVDGKNGVTVSDYIMIRKIILGIIKPTPIPTPVAKYTIVFDANGGSVSPGTKVYSGGTTYGDMPTPTRSGYTFVGWFTSKDGKFDYKYYHNKYTDLQNRIGLNEIVLRAHWYLNGRSEGRVCSETSVSKLSTVTKNITLYAAWEKKEETKYTVTFNANGGSVSPGSKEYKEGENYGDMPEPTRSGYTFVGWFTKPTGSFDYEYYYNTYTDLQNNARLNEVELKAHWYARGRDLEPRRCSADGISRGDKVTSNITLYAGWERNSDKFVITHYWGIDSPYVNDTQARYLRDAGFNLVMLSGGYNYSNHDAYVKGMGAALNKLKEHGLKAIVVGWDLPNFETESDSVHNKNITEIVNDFKGYTNVAEYFIGDEPASKALFSSISKVFDYIHNNDSSRDGTMSLLPAGQQASGDYRKDYLVPFAKTINTKTLSFDRYVFDKNGGVDKVNLYDNLEQVYYVAREYNKIPTAIVLLTKHGEFKNLLRRDIAFEVSVSLAYGMKRISYFTYSVDGISNQGFSEAMLDTDHERTTHYYDVQAVNKWLKKIGNELYDTNMIDVYGFNESSVVNYSKYGSGISASQAGLISMFDNKTYLLVNTAIQENKDNVFTFSSFDGVEYFDTFTNKWSKIGNTNNEFYAISDKKITIHPGYCILLRGGKYWLGSGSWSKDSNGTHYYNDPNGTRVKSSWIKSKGYWYYLGSNGGLNTGWIKVDNKWYHTDSSGARETGWIKDDNKWYYLNSNGVMQTGLVSYSGKKYYMNSSGEMQTGWIKVDNKWYYFDASNEGAAKTLSWLKDNNKWYYFNSDGTMVADQCKKIDDKEYCFAADGAMK